MSKFCPKCGKENGDAVSFCVECGNNLGGSAPASAPTPKKKGGLPVWAIILIVLGVIFLAIAGCCGLVASSINKGINDLNEELNGTTKYNYTGAASDNNPSTKKDEYGFDETFKFDGLEITIGKGYTFTTVKNSYSDYNGQSVIKLPVTLKNTTSETKGLNMFYYDVYGSKGTEVKTLDSYFDTKSSLTYGGDLRSGAGDTRYLYVQYDGDGLYAIEFNNYSEKITAEFEIKK